ncbi:hypothetical protein LV779_08460 [Streptomyces thinghirensis]|nr:hypothetical protein [Streptomyces thinghirensis]
MLIVGRGGSFSPTTRRADCSGSGGRRERPVAECGSVRSRIAELLESGDPPPTGSAGGRCSRINVRVTGDRGGPPGRRRDPPGHHRTRRGDRPGRGGAQSVSCSSTRPAR